MQKVEYKLVPIDNRSMEIGSPIELFQELGQEGWIFCSKFEDHLIFYRPISK